MKRQKNQLINHKMYLKLMLIAAILSAILQISNGAAQANAQLDLPPLNTASIRPDIYYNGYTPRENAAGPAHNTADVDRSQRFGPPYTDDGGGEDGADDFRNGPSYDDRMRYGYAYPQPARNFSRDSPFSDSARYTNENLYNSAVGDRYADDRRYQNHNYDNAHNNNNNNNPNTADRYDARTAQDRFNDPNSNRYNDPNNPNYNPADRAGQDRFNDPNNNNNRNSQDDYRQRDRYNQNSFNPANPNDPYSRQFPNDRARNPFENPFTNNRDRYNLNDRNAERERFQQERRYQIELEKLRNLLVETDQRGSLECTANVAAQWNFETNVNEFTQNEALNAQQRYVDYQRLVAEQSKTVNKDYIFDRRLYRQLMLQSEAGPNALPVGELDRYNRIINEMLFIYNGASICAFQEPFRCDLHYIPDLKQIMAKSRDWRELQHTWVEYHRKAGREMRDGYEQLIDVMNEVAYVNNVTNGGEYWYLAFESGNFREDLEIIWEQIRPLYEMLHAYTRRKLREFYGPDLINRNAPIPSHVLGNMFGQSWSNILDIIIPYPGRHVVDVTPTMLEQGYTPALMFQLAEEFFTSINMSAVGPEFYQNSLLEQPLDRRVLCEPSAWDFCNRHDFRVKMCTDISQKGLLSVHHEMAHVQYFLQYRHLPKVFRNGANPAFHQAVGDAIGLSISTPKHFQTLGLLQRSVDDTRYDINYLFSMAADKVAFLPFALALDNWRYDMFSGRENKKRLNCHFWELRDKYGGIKPPVLRSEQDFDVGAKYHVPANIPYIKYFFSTVLQFQIYRALCRTAGQYVPGDSRKPLHKCDIYRQPAAGNLLKQIMSKGASQPWQEVLQETLGEGRLDGMALREYFAPLEEWLRQENLRNQEFVGWNYDGDYCSRSIETANLQIVGGFYNDALSLKAGRWLIISILGSWLMLRNIFY